MKYEKSTGVETYIIIDEPENKINIIRGHGFIAVKVTSSQTHEKQRITAPQSLSLDRIFVQLHFIINIFF